MRASEYGAVSTEAAAITSHEERGRKEERVHETMSNNAAASTHSHTQRTHAGTMSQVNE